MQTRRHRAVSQGLIGRQHIHEARTMTVSIINELSGDDPLNSLQDEAVNIPKVVRTLRVILCTLAENFLR